MTGREVPEGATKTGGAGAENPPALPGHQGAGSSPSAGHRSTRVGADSHRADVVGRVARSSRTVAGAPLGLGPASRAATRQAHAAETSWRPSSCGEVRVRRIDDHVGRERAVRDAACDERQNEMAVRADGLSEADCRPDLGARKVIERKGNKNDLMLRHGKVHRRSARRCPLRDPPKNRKQG